MSKLTNMNDYIDEEVSPIVVLWMSQRCQPKLGNTSFGMKEKMYKMLIKLMDVKYNPKMRNKIAGLCPRATAVIYNVNLIS